MLEGSFIFFQCKWYMFLQQSQPITFFHNLMCGYLSTTNYEEHNYEGVFPMFFQWLSYD